MLKCIRDSSSEFIRNSNAGLQIGFTANGKTSQIYTAGYSNYRQKKLVDKSTIFQAASISKTIAFLATLSLVDKKLINLDLPYSNYLQNWKLPVSDHPDHQITVRNILKHKAGLSVSGYHGYFSFERLPSITESLNGKLGILGKIFRNSNLKITREPGTQFTYSGGGYSLLQLLIEEVTNTSYENFVKDSIFDQIQMFHSSFELSAIQNNYAKSYSKWRTKLPDFRFAEKAAAGLYTTATDLCNVLNAMYLLSKGERINIFQNDISSKLIFDDPESPAFGFFRICKEGKIKILEHDGSNIGWRSYFAIELEKGYGIVILSNTELGIDFIKEIRRKFLEVAL